MIAKECAQCGGRFQAKSNQAKYCSGRCRQRADAAPKVPVRSEGPKILALPPAKPSESGLLNVTKRFLEDADRLDTPTGQATLLLATILDSGVQDTGSSIAALVKQYDVMMTKALDGTGTSSSALERGRAARERRIA